MDNNEPVEPLTRVPRGYQVHLPGMLNSDDGLRDWLSSEGLAYNKWLGNRGLDCVDVSHNGITDEGVEHLLSYLMDTGRRTRRLKLFHNRLREPKALCHFVEHQGVGIGAKGGLQELHLSHNLIRVPFLEQLLQAISRASAGVDTSQSRHPLWLRLEENEDVTTEVVQRLTNHEDCNFKVCLACNNKSSGCNLQHCKNGADVHILLQKRRGR